MPQRSYRPDIDGLRAIAVLFILFYHAGFSPFIGGFIGVDIFFVISGYLITRNILSDLHDGTFSFKSFYIRRLRRLFPALVFTVAVTICFGLFLLAPEAMEELSKSAWYSLLALSNVFFWRKSGYFDTVAEFKPLLHTWSLGVEEQFYLLWPACLYGLYKYKIRYSLPFCVAAAGIASLAAAELYMPHDAQAVFFLTPFRVAEFVCGALCACAPPYKTPLRQSFEKRREITGIIALAFIFGPAFFYTEYTRFPGLMALLPCAGAACLILVQSRYIGHALRHPWMVGIGLISYSVYLIHWPLIFFYKLYMLRPLQGIEPWLMVAASLLFGFLMYRYIETPFRHAKENNSRRSIKGCAAACAGLCLLAVIIQKSDGFTWRVPATAQAIIKDPNAVYGGEDCVTGFCTFGDPQHPDFAVIGDSHVRAYYEGLKTLAETNRLSFAVFEDGSCPFFTEGKNAEEKADDVCTSVKTKAFDYLKEHQPRTIILAQNWFSVRRYQSADGRIHDFSRDTTPATYTVYVATELKNMRDKNIIPEHAHIILIGAVPIYNRFGELKSCLAMPTFVRPAPPRCDTIPLAGNDRKAVNDHLRTALSSIKNLTFYDPFDALCDAEYCYFLKENALLYSDNGHLSKQGSVQVINQLPSAITNHLAGQ